MADIPQPAARAHARAAAASRSGRARPPGRRRARRLSGRRRRGAGGRGGSRSTGSPASRSARSTPRSSPAIRPRQRVAKLRGFWEEVTAALPALPFAGARAMARMDAHALGRLRRGAGRARLLRAAPAAARCWRRRRASARSASTTAPRSPTTLDEYVDWDLLNDGPVRLSVGAVDVETGNFHYFDTHGPSATASTRATSWPRARCRRACRRSRSTAPGGGTAASSPTRRSPMSSTIRARTCWSSRSISSPRAARCPATIMDVYAREKDIRYSSRTRQVTDQLIRLRKEREAIRKVLAKLPADARRRSRRQGARRAGRRACGQRRPPHLPQAWLGRRRRRFRILARDDGASLGRGPRRASPRRCATTPCSPATSSTARPRRSICAMTSRHPAKRGPASRALDPLRGMTNERTVHVPQRQDRARHRLHLGHRPRHRPRARRRGREA